jgi:hypothetical protein
MALPVNRPISELTVGTFLADLATAGSAFAVAPCRGRIVRAYSVIANAITTANGTWSLEINGTAVTGSTGTIAYDGSAAGDVDTVEPTGANTVNEGDTIEFVNGGECDTTTPTMFYAVIERD